MSCQEFGGDSRTIESVRQGAEHPVYPFEDWQYEVCNGDTRLGYADWCLHQAEADAFFFEADGADHAEH